MGCELHGHYSWIDKEFENINDEDDPDKHIDVMWTGQKLYELPQD